MKSTSLSVRVNDDDAMFLATLQIGDAKTPSEKLRALLRSERRRQEGTRDAVEAADMVKDLLQPARRRVRALQSEAGVRSDLLKKVYDGIPEIAGLALVGPGQGGPGTPEDLKAFERLVVDEVFNLVQDLMELGLTPKNRVLDVDTVGERIDSVLEFIELINIAKKRKKGRP